MNNRIPKINEEALCVLKYAEASDEMIVSFLDLDDCLTEEYEKEVLLSTKEDCKELDVVNRFYQHPLLNRIFSSRASYCKVLYHPYEGLDNIYYLKSKFENRQQSSGDYYLALLGIHTQKEKCSQEDIDKIKERLDNFREELFHYVISFYLDQAYKKVELDEKVLAFSHRKRGWSAPVFTLGSNFLVEFKTNFGYGRSSYFYTILIVDGVRLVAFSDWTKYQYAKLLQNDFYSFSHPIWDNNCWFDAMKKVCDAFNIYKKNKAEFLQIYLIKECEELIRGLVDLLDNDRFKVLKGDYRFFDHGEKNFEEVQLDGHNLIEYRGRKISGALDFIPLIENYSVKANVEFFIREITRLNRLVLPQLSSEKSELGGKIKDLEKLFEMTSDKLEKLKQQEENYQHKKEEYISTLEIAAFLLSSSEIENKFRQKFPEYAQFKTSLAETISELNQLGKRISTLIKVNENITKYETIIVDHLTLKD